jgi:hypothetical protein
MLEPVNKGVGASFLLELENIGSCSFLHIGACKQGGWSLLPVGAREFWKLVLPMNVIFKIYIKKVFYGFLPFGFPRKILVYCVSMVVCL